MELLKEREGLLDFPCDVERLPNGNTLIADAGDNTGKGSEIIEVNTAGQIVWHYADGLRFAHSAKLLPNGNILITDTTNNRVIEVTRKHEIVFNSDDWGGGTGRLSDGSHLHYPNDAHLLEDDTLLITDRNNDRCLIVNRHGKVIWEYKGARHPHNADMLPTGNVILADSDGNRVIEVDRQGRVVWSYSGDKENVLSWPRDADRLPNGNTLIGDSKHSRVLEVTPEGKIVWIFEVPYFANFYDVDKLPDGNVLISDQQHHQVLEVDQFGNIVWLFRNDRVPYPVLPKLMNGNFKQQTVDGLPEYWMPYFKTSEGGGKIIWDTSDKNSPSPGVEFDRDGAFCLYQVVGVKAGRKYTFRGDIRAEILNGGAVVFFQLAFLDTYGGLIEDVSTAPKGTIITQSTKWFRDTVTAIAPPRATAVEVRLFISGSGRAWMRNVEFFEE